MLPPRGFKDMNSARIRLKKTFLEQVLKKSSNGEKNIISVYCEF